jgi:hypothetical protein
MTTRQEVMTRLKDLKGELTARYDVQEQSHSGTTVSRVDHSGRKAISGRTDCSRKTTGFSSTGQVT